MELAARLCDAHGEDMLMVHTNKNTRLSRPQHIAVACTLRNQKK